MMGVSRAAKPMDLAIRNALILTAELADRVDGRGERLTEHDRERLNVVRAQLEGSPCSPSNPRNQTETTKPLRKVGQTLEAALSALSAAVDLAIATRTQSADASRATEEPVEDVLSRHRKSAERWLAAARSVLPPG